MNIENKTFLITSTLLFFSYKIIQHIQHEKFNSEKWKTSNLNSVENFDLRWSMINNL